MKKLFILPLLLLVTVLKGYPQTWSLEAVIENLPEERVYLEALKGDDENVIDSAASLEGRFKFIFDTSMNAGVYRVRLGSEDIDELFGRETKSFDIIFDRENIELRTSYNNPVKNMTFIRSDENQIYYSFLRARAAYGAKFKALLPLLRLYNRSDPFFEPLSDEFVRIQQGLTDTLLILSGQKPGSFVSSLISMFPEPVFNPDSGTSITMFMRDHYFDLVNMNDPSLINSPVYTQKVITYLSFFREPSAGREKQEELYMKAIDGIMDEVKYNPRVHDFILNYLIDGFDRFKMENVLVYIADNYLGAGCETDDEKIMNERLEAYTRMSPGQTVMDIVLRDNHNRPRRLSDMPEDYVLLVFWASWCPHCRDLMPELKEWYEKQDSGPEIGIYAVSIDTSLHEWKTYLAKHDLPWVNVNEPEGWDGKVARQFNLYATPTMFILDRKRKILEKPVTFREFKREAARLKD